MKPGRTYLTITIDKIGLKDPNGFVDPFVTVSVKSEPTTTLMLCALSLHLMYIHTCTPPPPLPPPHTHTRTDYFGVNLETSQDTPVATQREVSYIVFSIPVEIQHAIEDIPRGECMGHDCSLCSGSMVLVPQVQLSSLSSSTSTQGNVVLLLIATPSWKWTKSAQARHSLKCEFVLPLPTRISDVCLCFLWKQKLLYIHVDPPLPQMVGKIFSLMYIVYLLLLPAVIRSHQTILARACVCYQSSLSISI